MSFADLRVAGAPVSGSNPLPVTGGVGGGSSGPVQVASASLSNVASSATAVTLLASNASRNHATIVNDSTSALYVKMGAAASTTSYTVKLLAGDTYETPQGVVYTGQITGIWAAANGAARVTEL